MERFNTFLLSEADDKPRNLAHMRIFHSSRLQFSLAIEKNLGISATKVNFSTPCYD